MAIRFNQHGPIRDRILDHFARSAKIKMSGYGIEVGDITAENVGTIAEKLETGEASSELFSKVMDRLSRYRANLPDSESDGIVDIVTKIDVAESIMRSGRVGEGELKSIMGSTMDFESVTKEVQDIIGEMSRRGSPDPTDIPKARRRMASDLGEEWDHIVGEMERYGKLRENMAQAAQEVRSMQSTYDRIIGKSTIKTSLKETQEIAGSKYSVTMAGDESELLDNLLKLEKEIRDVAKANDITLPEGGSTNMLAMLPRDAAERIRGKYATVLGLEQMIESTGVGEWVVSPNDAARLGSGSTAFSSLKFDPSQEMGLAEAFLSNVYLRYRPEVELRGSGMSASAEAISLPGDLPTVDALMGYMRQAKEMREGTFRGTQAIFDLETSGVNIQSDDIWQLAVRYSDSDDVDVLHFPSRRMMAGSVEDGKPLLSSLMDGREFSTLDDLKAVMSRMVEKDYLVGHNIDKFDLPFLSGTIDRIGSVLGGDSDEEFMQLAASLKSKISGGETMDTLALMRTLSSDLNLSVADEILDLYNAGAISQKVPYSMENIILQTNLLELMRDHYDDFSMGNLLGEMERGLHYADVDTIFERALANPEIFKNLKSITREEALSIPGFDPADLSRFRDIVLKSDAMTPFLPMRQDTIDEPVYRYLMDMAGISVDDAMEGTVSLDITPYEYEAILQRIRAESSDHARGRFNPHLTRAEAGEFARFLKERGLTVDDFVTSDIDGYGDFQDFLRSRGVPFDNISAEERRISGLLSQITTPVTPTTGTPAEKLLGDVIPNTRFFATRKLDVVGQSRTVAIPKEVLLEAEKSGVFDHPGKSGRMTRRTSLKDGTEMYSLSPFSYKYRGRTLKNISKDFMLSDDVAEAVVEIERLLNFLGDRGYASPEELVEIEKGLMASLHTRGGAKVQVGVARPVNVSPTGSAIDDAYDALIRATGADPSSKFADESSSIRFVVGDVGEEVELPSGHRMQRSGPAVFDVVGRTRKGRAEYHADAGQGRVLIDEVIGLGESGPSFRMAEARKAAGDAAGGFGERLIGSWRDRVTPNRGKIAIGSLAVAGAAGWLLHRRGEREDEWFTDPRTQMPMEDEGYMSAIGPEAEHVNFGRSRAVDPFRTIDVVSNLDYNKIGHTTMGAGKYDNLFWG